MSGCRFIDGECAALVLVLLEHQNRHKRELRLVNVRRPVRRLLRLAGVERTVYNEEHQ